MALKKAYYEEITGAVKMEKLSIIKFWIVAFSVIIYQCVKGNDWHSVSVYIHTGDNENGPITKNYSAMKTADGFKFNSFKVPNVKPIEI